MNYTDHSVVTDPLSAVSAAQFHTLPNDDQWKAIASLINGAVYCDSWLAYFDFADRNSVPITDEIALEAVQAVGLDPCSVHLWICAADACSDISNKRNIVLRAQTVPLYDSSALVKYWKTQEESLGTFPAAVDPHIKRITEEEVWPDRYADVTNVEERSEVRRQWISLMKCMMDELTSETIAKDLQVSRMDLAFRQMCLQLKDDDSCWYEYCLFLIRNMNDEAAAEEMALTGLQQIPCDSFALRSILSFLKSEQVPTVNSAQFSALITQRTLAEELSLQHDSKEAYKTMLKSFRNVGKNAAANAIDDWKIYSQWCKAEDVVVKDTKMASKVLDNGMKCCSSSNNAILLGNEGIDYHAFHRRDREAQEYAEHQVQQTSSSQHRGKRHAAWNKLISTERCLGMNCSKTESRRAEVFPTSYIHSFLERCRVGCYLPCSAETYRWLEFSEDFACVRRHEKEAPLKDFEPASSRALWPESVATVNSSCMKVNESEWCSGEFHSNPFTANENDNPDEVVGPRDLRGKWVYRIKVNKATELRLQREEKLRKMNVKGSSVDVPDSAIGRLTKRIRALTFTDDQASRLHSLSSDWVIERLVSAELNLSEQLKSKGPRLV